MTNMTPRQSDNMERALGQLQGQVESMAETIKSIAKQAQDAATTASAERHEMRDSMSEMKAEISAARKDIADMKPLHDRLRRSGYIVTGVLLCAGAIGGAFGSKLTVLWSAVYGAAK